jgi:3-phenylpropionate/cinnamic acid dioxygenase small subunit
MTSNELAARLTAVEDRLAIGQLPIRYALAVDGRDIDAWVNLFEPDIDMGRYGRGREVLREFITPQVKWFYRSHHLICGQRVDLLDETSATGQTYCRAEHEVGDRYVIMSICYDDSYIKVDGEWFFRERRERHWYAVDVLERPQSAPGFASWDHGRNPALPHGFPTWTSFWDGVDLAEITSQP